MAQQSTCPACGAPIEFSRAGGVIRCEFCGTDVQLPVESAPAEPHVVVRVPSQEPGSLQDLFDAVENQPQPVEQADVEKAPAMADDLFGAAGPSQGGVVVDALPGGQVIDAPAPYQSFNPPMASSGNRNRVIAFVAGGILLLCLGCACVAVVVAVIQANGFGG